MSSKTGTISRLTGCQLEPWPEQAGIAESPVRTEIHRGNLNPTSYIFSHKIGRKIQCLSPNERAFVILAEVDPNVSRISDRPLESVANIDGKIDRHFPDYAILINGRAEIHEVKSDDAYAHESLIRRLSHHALRLEARDCVYSVALASQLTAKPKYQRVERLWTFTHFKSSDHTLYLVNKFLREAGRSRLADLMAFLEAQLTDSAPRRGAILGMAARGEVFFDFDDEVGLDMLLRIRDAHALPDRLIPIRRPFDDLHAIYRSGR